MNDFVDKPECSKCGNTATVDVKYQSFGTSDIDPMFFQIVGALEFLDCECKRCGFTWNMKTKEQMNATDTVDA